MSVKRYDLELSWSGRFAITEMSEGNYVDYMDYVDLNTRYHELSSNFDKLQADKEHLEEYTDHLVSFSKLACLPKDLENIRETNTKFAMEIEDLKLSRDWWIEMYQNVQKKLSEVMHIVNS